MVKWNLSSLDPGNFIIAADQRCGNTIYPNDHIWELSLSGGDPPSISIQTTFGLRARTYRIFPRFLEGDTAISIRLHFRYLHVCRNSILISYRQLSRPFEGIDVILEFWVPNSNTLTGRIKLTNSRLNLRKIEVQWAALLSPDFRGEKDGSP